MREILFRGKRKDNGEWEYGFFIGRYDPLVEQDTVKYGEIDNGTIFSEPVKVDLETVGRYTGLKDKNGTKIFEGDCIVDKDYIDIQKRMGKKPSYGIVESEVWNCGCCYSVYGFSTGGCEPDLSEDVIIIGNIYDNPELLKGE